MSLRGGPALLEGGTPLVWLLLGVVLLLLVAASARQVVGPGQQAVVLRFGRAHRVRGPGLVVHVPGLEQVRTVSTNLSRIDGGALRASTREGVRVRVQVVVLYRVVNPVVALEADPAICLLEDLERVTRHDVARGGVAQLLHGREVLAGRLLAALALRASAAGAQVLDVDIVTVEVELSQEVLRLMR